MTALTLPIVRKTSAMLELEQRHGGRDIRVIIKELYDKLGSQVMVAQALGLEQSTVSIWAVRLGIEFTSRPVAHLTPDNGQEPEQ